MSAQAKLPQERRSRTLLLAAGGPVVWPDVLRVLQDDETRSATLNRYKASGFSADSFRLRSAREAMADALSRTEDWLEGHRATKRRDRQLERMRAVRRRLEWEV